MVGEPKRALRTLIGGYGEEEVLCVCAVPLRQADGTPRNPCDRRYDE
jgi:hypothetical protein